MAGRHKEYIIFFRALVPGDKEKVLPQKALDLNNLYIK